MEHENFSVCPVCDQHDYTFCISAKDHTVTNEVFKIQKCSSCGFMTTNPRPSLESIGEYYASENYISHSGKSKTIFDKLYLAARKLTLNWKYELITEHISKPARILDFGCGTGEFLHTLKAKNWNVTGVEPNILARQKANHLLGNKVVKELQGIEDVYDAITLWHVLEHIHLLNPTLQKIKNCLSPSGIIFIAVPNPESHDCKHYKEYWAGYDVPRHLWHFTRETMTALLRKNGLKIIDIKPMKLDSYYVSLLSEGYKNPGTSKPLLAINAIIEGFKSNLSAQKTKEYSSLIYIAKRE
jgi:2-polyprenyl-3-methyl-5-hydroxy-6-metoxy-1,4-benzoquinol methylase